MGSRKALAVILCASMSSQVAAYEIHDPVERTLVITTLAPSFLVVATTGGTTMAMNSLSQSAKTDALAFIGSDGEIRGPQFEQAVRYYHAAYDPPYMSDEQFALAIAASS